MPKVVRNFWIEGSTDSGTRFGTGPRGRENGFHATIYIRDEGTVALGARIDGRALSDGSLVLDIEGANGERIEVRTKR